MVNERHRKFVERYFQYTHLPADLQPVSRVFYVAAREMLKMPCKDPAEMTSGLRKLLEAKDCAVRMAV